MAEEDVVLITQFPSDSWFEGFVVRPNGKVLATRLDKPELYTFDPEDPEAIPELVCTLPDCNSFVNICAIPGFSDEYYILTSTANLELISHKNAWLWRLVMAGDDGTPPKTTRVTRAPEDGYCLGVVAVSDRIVLLPDGVRSCIWHLDTKTGKKSVFAQHESMTCGAGDGYFSVNRIQVVGDFLYFSNSGGGTIGRIPVELDLSDDEVGIRVRGDVETVVDSLPSYLDGLAVSPNQTHAYVASHIDGHLHKIAIDSAIRKGTTEVVMRSLDNPTGLHLISSRDGSGKTKLYIVCCGEIEVAWMPREDDPWEAVRDINSAVTVTVTHEIRE
ncbi:hypothetical protein F4861DRAFT_315721 [Xylaria intraflava]|nr:hypothetical protein F4861DRAFT_315721 [Xylaria intraflava]